MIEEKRQNNIHAYAMQYLKVILVACQVWSKVKLLHTLYGSYLNHVRQALYALQNIKHVVYYNAMQGTTQAHFFSEVTKIKHIKLIPQPTKCSLIWRFSEDIRQLILGLQLLSIFPVKVHLGPPCLVASPTTNFPLGLQLLSISKLYDSKSSIIPIE